MNTSPPSTRVWLCAVLLNLVAVPVWADGELDTTFGTNGVVKITFPNSALGYLRDAATVNGIIIAAGYPNATCSFPDLFVVKLSLTGTVIGSPSTYPQNAIECPEGLTVDSESGDIFIVGQGAVARFDDKGTLLATASLTGRCYAPGILDSHRRYVVPCTNFSFFDFEGQTISWPAGVSVMAVDTTSDPLTATTVGGMEFPDSNYPKHEHLTADSIVQDAASGDYYVGGWGGWCPQNNPACYVSNSALVVLRFNGTSGAYDTSYGSGGAGAVKTQCGSSFQSMAVDDADDLVVAGYGCIARFDPAGTLDQTFGQDGLVQFDTGISGVSSDLLRRIYVLEIASGLLRLNVDGTLDVSFASNTNIGTLNGGNSAWQALKLTDSSRSSAYLLGGVDGPCVSCGVTPATTALIAKVMLVSDVSVGGGSGNGGVGAGGGAGGGGTFSLWELCGMLLLGLWRGLFASQPIPEDDRGV